jgi:anthranilate phosphoribosyltransferase
VAKHGNRSASSKVGSADVLEYLGVNLSAPSEKVAAALDGVGVTFLFAPGWHPALKSVANLRKTLKVRTVFNLLGPLVNPLRPTGQVIGVYDQQFLTPMATALAQMGTPKAIIVHGREKLDEVGLGDLTDMALLNNGEVISAAIDPLSIAIPRASLMPLKAGKCQKMPKSSKMSCKGGERRLNGMLWRLMPLLPYRWQQRSLLATMLPVSPSLATF